MVKEDAQAIFEQLSQFYFDFVPHYDPVLTRFLEPFLVVSEELLGIHITNNNACSILTFGQDSPRLIVIMVLQILDARIHVVFNSMIKQFEFLVLLVSHKFRETRFQGVPLVGLHELD